MGIVYVLGTRNTAPSGGVMRLYQFVDTLNANNIESFIIYNTNPGLDWFTHSTKTTEFKSVQITQDDLLIIPEVMADKVLTIFPGVRKIIFNQNSFKTFKPFIHGNFSDVRKAYFHPDVVQTIVASDYDVNVLSRLFPGIKLGRFYYGINDKLFYFQPNKKKIISVMPRKQREDALFLECLLKTNHKLNDFEIKIIDEMPYEECAEILRESAIFLSFSYQESFGLPPAEAMACGCIVIGYHGQGGKEFFKKELSYSIEQSNLIEYAEQVNKVIEQYTTNYFGTLQIGKRASEYILEKYSMAKQEKSILDIIRPLMLQPHSR
ncbi:glycosyltransferase [Pedobacter sp. WC2423]|uniref:glycosyltransferase n=1 Tax=Pedobacter sp. WC2423 TaxID=3234142 RepID=UPI00346634AE